MKEGSKKEISYCSAGTLLYHHWEEAHYNIKPDILTRGLHIEVTPAWFDYFQIPRNVVEGSFSLKDPAIILLFYQIFKEVKMIDSTLRISVNQLLLHVFSKMVYLKSRDERKPGWVSRIDDLLHEQFSENLNLRDLSNFLGIHPVHLSRDFSKYFHCTLGEYIRKLRVSKSLALFDEQESLTGIALECGFADQSHFIRCFKQNLGTTPTKFRKLIGK
jgi:AraC-like DNA-binding protein